MNELVDPVATRRVALVIVNPLAAGAVAATVITCGTVAFSVAVKFWYAYEAAPVRRSDPTNEVETVSVTAEPAAKATGTEY